MLAFLRVGVACASSRSSAAAVFGGNVGLLVRFVWLLSLSWRKEVALAGTQAVSTHPLSTLTSHIILLCARVADKGLRVLHDGSRKVVRVMNEWRHVYSARSI